MKRWWPAVLLAAMALGGWVAFQQLGNPHAREVRRIRQRLEGLAAAVSFTDKDPIFVKLGYPDRLVSYFADPTHLDLSVGRRHEQATRTRGELRDGLASLRAAATGLSVEFLDIAVELDAARQGAVAHLTSKIYFTGDADYWVQEFRLDLEKPQDHWLVRRITTIRTMEQ